jgi:hypothetical protein
MRDARYTDVLEMSVSDLSVMPGRFRVFHASPDFPARLIETGFVPPLPIFRCRATGEISDLVWGWSVLDTAGKMGVESLTVREAPGSLLEQLKLALLLENRSNAYTYSEMTGVLGLLEQGARETGVAPEIAEKELEGLVLSSGSFMRDAVRYRNLPPYLQRLADHGKIDLKTAEALMDLPARIPGMISGVQGMSFSDRRIALRIVREIAVREGLGPDELVLLCESAIASGAVLETLRARRYPRLTDLGRRLDRYRTAILQDTGIDLQPPAGFEGDTYSIRFEFSSSAVLKRRMDALRRVADNTDPLWELI